MKSRITLLSYYKKALDEESKKAVARNNEGYRRRLTRILLAVFMLTANETWGIGKLRMCRMVDKYTENLNYALDYIELGVGEEILMNRLKQHNLKDIYDYIVGDKQPPTPPKKEVTIKVYVDGNRDGKPRKS